MTAPEVIVHAKQILTLALKDMDILLSMYDEKDVMTMDLLMTRKEAGAFIGRTVQSIDRLCREGKLRKTYVQGLPRIRKSELLKFKGIVFTDSKQHKPMSELESILEKYRPEIITHK